MADTYAEYQSKQLTPRWLRGPWGTKWSETMGAIKDRLRDAAITAIKERYPSTCTDAALPYVGRTRNIERYFPETAHDYRARLDNAWGIWDMAGSKAILEANIGQAGYTIIDIFAWKDLPSPPAPYENHWSAFWVWIDAAAMGIELDGPWGDGLIWGDGGSWGTNTSENAPTLLRNLINKWKPANQICPWALLAFGPVWSPLDEWGDGSEWGGGETIKWDMLPTPRAG